MRICDGHTKSSFSYTSCRMLGGWSLFIGLWHLPGPQSYTYSHMASFEWQDEISNMFRASYLTNREQRVVLEGTMSDPVAVTSGVPQGSILGPLLFNIFMNSIANIMQPVHQCQTHSIRRRHPSLQAHKLHNRNSGPTGRRQWNQLLDAISHGLTANHSKTKLTRFRRTIPVNIDINNHASDLPMWYWKYLGVTINNDRNGHVIHNTCKKTKQHLDFIHRKFHQSPPQIRNKIYRTAVLPKLDYCGAVWDPHHHTDMESVQKCAGKIVTKQWRAEYPDLLASLN